MRGIFQNIWPLAFKNIKVTKGIVIASDQRRLRSHDNYMQYTNLDCILNKNTGFFSAMRDVIEKTGEILIPSMD